MTADAQAGPESVNAAMPKHVPSIDGLRAVAFVLVFLSHAGFRVAGTNAVALFFFLSGFLITTQLRLQYERTGTLKVRRFWIRRFFRIFPPMWAALILAILATWAGLMEGSIGFWPAAAQFLGLTNYWVTFISDEGMPRGTSIYWYMSVSEQFYLVYPLLLLFLLRRVSRQTCAAVFAALCAGALLWRYGLALYGNMWDGRTYLCTDTRFDSILFGAILALCCNPSLDPVCVHRFRSKAGLLLLSLALFIVSVAFRSTVFRETLRYSVQGLSLYPVFYLAIIHPEWRIFRWLNHRWVMHLGAISYALYLVHFVILYIVYHFVDTGNPTVNLFLNPVIAAPLSLFVAVLFYHGVEQPVDRLRKRLGH